MPSPFSGAVKKKITKKHRPLIWENMLGTVYADNPLSEEDPKYFDYDYEAARKYAGITDGKVTDLRLDRATRTRTDGPRQGQLVLYGVIVKN